MPIQRSLLGRGEPAFDAAFGGMQRRALDGGAWYEYLADWVDGQESLFEALAASTRWQQQERPMYERTVVVPRLVASLPQDGPGHPLIPQMQRALEARYHSDFPMVTMALYRDGNDSVAWHGDYVAREREEAVIATVSLGSPRRFLLRPKGGGGRSLAMSLGWGDLIVMGGTCQRTWEHSIPKVKQADPRLVIMFRSEYGRGA
jgi:alkylated DNA repair dioxygenase AlkB